MTRSILLITVDCLRPDHISGYGYDRETTPNIDTLIARGTRLTRAYSNGPGTRFGFKALHAGTHPLRIKGAGLPRQAGDTLAEVLGDQGYQTGGFSDNPFVSEYFNYHRGFDEFADYRQWTINDSRIPSLSVLNRFIRQQIGPSIPTGRIYEFFRAGFNSIVKWVEGQGANVNSNDDIVVDNALEWISNAEERTKPYFAWVHLMDAHHPYGYFPEHRKSLNIPSESKHVRMPSVEVGTSPPQEAIDAYDTNIKNADKQVGRLLEAIKKDVMIIVTADHGEEFGRHNQFHTESVYQSMAHIPLIIDAVGFDNETWDTPVSLLDVPATVARAGGANAPDYWDGEDLRAVTRDRDVFIGFENNEGVQSAVVRRNWKYVRLQDLLNSKPDSEQLFNIEMDPEEQNNQLESKDSLSRDLRERWEEFCREILDHRFQAEHDLWDPQQNPTETVNSYSEASVEHDETIDKRLEELGYK